MSGKTDLKFGTKALSRQRFSGSNTNQLSNEELHLELIRALWFFWAHLKLLCFDVWLNQVVHELRQSGHMARLFLTEHIKIKSLWKELEVIYKPNANFKLHITLIVGILDRREYEIGADTLWCRLLAWGAFRIRVTALLFTCKYYFYLLISIFGTWLFWVRWFCPECNAVVYCVI